MVFNATFNNISAILWWSVLLVKETRLQRRENHRPVASHWQTLSHNVVHLAYKLNKYQYSQSKFYGPVHIGWGAVVGCDHMVVGFTTTYAISAYHHWCCEFESRSGQGGLWILVFI
jgi:hypothetical protein